MINIIVVEDNPTKLASIKALINNAMGKYAYNAVDFNNIMDAKRSMYKNKYDLMILDLVLPHGRGGNASDDTGFNFLKEINSNPSIKPPIYIVGLTERKDLKPIYEDHFNDEFWQLIEYDATSEKWQKRLEKFLWYILKTKEELIENNSYNFDLAIITALSNPELKSVLNLVNDWEEKRFENDSTAYHINSFKRNSKKCSVVACCAPQMGMNAAAVSSMKMISYFRPRYIVMVGIAAGVKGNVNFGDILVAEQTWDGGSGKIISEEKSIKFKPDGKYLSLDTDVKDKMKIFGEKTDVLHKIRDSWNGKIPDTVLKVHIGPVASVAGVIQSEEKILELAEPQRKLIGLEMETYGVFYAAHNCTKPRPIPISIKSVTDFGDVNKNDDYQKYAAYTSAKFMFEFVMEELI